MEAGEQVVTLNIVKGLRMLEEIERDKGELYETLASHFIAGSGVSALFARLGLDQASRRSVIQYQARVVARNRQVFLNLGMPLAPLVRLQQVVAGYQALVADTTRSDAIAAALRIEELTLELHDHFPRLLGEHFGPFVASLAAGTARHLQLLDRTIEEGATPSRPSGHTTGATGGSDAPPVRSHPPALSVTRPDVDDLLGHMHPASLRTLLEALPDGAFLATPDRRVVYWNSAAEHITGFTAAEMVNHACHEDGLNHVSSSGALACRDGCPLQMASAGTVTNRQSMLVHHRDGHRVPVSVTVLPISSTTGSILGSVQLFRKELPDETGADAGKLALLDPLTELPSRKHLESVLLSRLNELQRHGWPFGIALLRLDALAEVNATRGHGAGDQLLRMVARTLAANVRASDTVGRFTGDQFLVVLANADHEKLQVATEKLRLVVERSEGSSGPDPLSTTVTLHAVEARPEDTVESLLVRCEDTGSELAGHDAAHTRPVVGAPHDPEPATRSGRSLLSRAARLVRKAARPLERDSAAS